MLTLRLTVMCAFLIAFSFFITSISAHDTTVVIDSATGGEFPSRRVELTDRHPAHPSISARASARKKMTADGIDSCATASVSATQSITFPNGAVGTTYGYAEVTGGSGRDEDCGNYSGSLSEGAGDWTEDDYPGDHLSDASAESGSNVSNQISQSADCDISI